ncbi:MAG: AAA family ATPase [Flavobacteriales bacterium]|nr:AAA family ATPase [Flavobacteriales bacterium]
MPQDDLHKFSADRPVEIIENDLLGRSGFAIDLAEAIMSWHGADSLVIALHGEWGSGKTSIKNMAMSVLKKRQNNIVIEFSPWEWAAQDKISASFFNEIASSLGQIDNSKTGKKIAALLKRYGRYLNTGEEVVNGLTQSLPYLFAIVIPLGIGASYFQNDNFRIISAAIIGVLGLWAAFLKWGNKFINAISGNISAALKDAELSINELRTRIVAALKTKARPIIIVMDDLDRLTSDQIKMVIQLVKANSGFPNVVFLLLFQRDIVEDKLNDGNQSGRDYLEKIIQVPFDIPAIEISTIHKLLFRNLDQIVNTSDSAAKMFENGYWANVFYGGLSGYFDNLRSVYRFCSTLSFHFHLLRGRSRFEVNPVDLIAIECIRLFEPDVYLEISRLKNVLTKSSSTRGESKDQTRATLDAIFAKAHKNPEMLKELIKRLFPTIEWAMGGTHYYPDIQSSWLRQARICHPSMFDRYFQFTIPVGEISISDLKEMVEYSGDSGKFTERISALNSAGLAKVALSQFESFVKEIPRENGVAFMKALFEIGDIVDNESEGFFEFSANLHAVRIVIAFLRGIEEQNERDKIVIEAFNDSFALSVIEQLLQSEESRRAKQGETEIIFSDDAFDLLKNRFVDKINIVSSAQNVVFLKCKYFNSIVYRWARWGDPEKVSSWLEDQIKTTTGVIALLNAFVRKTKSFSAGDYVSKTNLYIKKDEINNFIPIAKVADAIQKINRQELDASEIALLALFEAETVNPDRI